MDKFDNLLQKLNDRSIIQFSVWEDDLYEISEEVDGNTVYPFEDDFSEGNYKVVARDLNPDKHRWQEYSTDVVEIYGRFLGICKVSNVYSEQMSISDICHSYEFFEMEPTVVTTYKVKKCQS